MKIDDLKQKPLWQMTGEEFLYLQKSSEQKEEQPVIKASAPELQALGKVLGPVSAGLNSYLFFVGISDGTKSVSDWCTGISAGLGIGGIIAGSVLGFPAIAAALGVGSVIFGIASMFAPGDDGRPGIISGGGVMRGY